MNTMFPFGLDAAVQGYLALYLLTLVVHAFFAAYVVSGSLWLCWATVFPGPGAVPRSEQRLAVVLRDWMPFVLSAAITAAVAPLLFVQVLYRQQFYTANLLLGWRWMVVVPVLIVAFYLLYVLKSRFLAHTPRLWSAMVALGAGVCFVFVGFCWTTNHLLSIESTRWVDAYQSGTVVAAPLRICSRLAMWMTGTFAVMPVLAGWQLLSGAGREPSSGGDREAASRGLAVLSLGALAVSGVCAGLYVLQLTDELRESLTGSAGWPWLVIATAGIALQCGGWIVQLRQQQLNRGMLLLITVGSTLMLCGVAAGRELLRVAHVGIVRLTANAQAAAAVGGLLIFLVFAVVNTVLIGICIQQVRSHAER